MPVMTFVFGLAGLVGASNISLIYDNLDHQRRFWYTIIVTGAFYALATLVCLVVLFLQRRRIVMTVETSRRSQNIDESL